MNDENNAYNDVLMRKLYQKINTYILAPMDMVRLVRLRRGDHYGHGGGGSDGGSGGGGTDSIVQPENK